MIDAGNEEVTDHSPSWEQDRGSYFPVTSAAVYVSCCVIFAINYDKLNGILVLITFENVVLVFIILENFHTVSSVLSMIS